MNVKNMKTRYSYKFHRDKKLEIKGILLPVFLVGSSLQSY